MEIQYLKIWKDEGIMYYTFADDLHVTLEIAKICVEQRIILSAGKDYPQLINMQGIKSVTKDAREYFANEGSKLVKAGALIVGSPLNRMLGNIFLSINKPKVPTRLFTDEQKAKQWLKQYL